MTPSEPASTGRLADVGTTEWLHAYDPAYRSTAARQARVMGILCTIGVVVAALAAAASLVGVVALSPEGTDRGRALLWLQPVLLAATALSMWVLRALWRDVRDVFSGRAPVERLRGGAGRARRWGTTVALAPSGAFLLGLLLPVGAGWDRAWAVWLLPASLAAVVCTFLAIFAQPNLQPVER